MDFPDRIYIDGVLHRATKLDLGTFYVDCPELPARPCAQHHLFPDSVHHMRNGGAVRTGGHRYSLWPDVGEKK